ncbi:HNH endonuclease signature motif containing protein [Actinomadura sp. 7K534]|uniref:HNH endonuclease signature motif containing protein n=1 Tax=Actinomadura sp. 7K534 TaxID=2530366 RepID=UPI001047E42C|nr:HNH endonuclease signature motif containing protein [Actinomadura sp. 7K534]TDB96478.1 HNH endonuclease [Actinomadura sp. 7K534]
MERVAVDLAVASTMELVNAASAIAAELARREPPESAAACLELTEALSTATDMNEAALTGFVSVVDAGREVQRWGFPSTQSWLRNRLGMRDSRAKERLVLARQRHRLTEVTGRWSAGDLSLGYAATIAGAVARLDDEDCATAEKILLGMVAQDFSAGKVASFGRRIRDVIAERDGTEPAPDDAQRGYDRSWLDSTRSLDGGRYIKGWLNAEDAAIWDGTLGPLAKPAGTDDRRDLSERTAAALSSVLSGGHKATKVTVICDLDTLTGGTAPGRLTDGTPVPAEQARRIALAAGVSPLLLGRGHVPLYLGYRERFASPGQRRVLEALYPTCAVVGCEVPGTLSEVDHVNGWALGDSPTDVDQLTLTCGFHNRYKAAHPGRITVRRDTEGRYSYRLQKPETGIGGKTVTPIATGRPPPWNQAA